MISIQQLEKLQYIRKSFESDDSLESTVAIERVNQLIDATNKIIRQRAFLRDERRIVRDTAERIEERKSALVLMRRHDWLPKSIIDQTNEKKINLNISGMLFEIPHSDVSKDPNSLLFALIQSDPPLLVHSDGYYYFDRDWWLFRYIVMFLRDGTLSDDRLLLSQLYREASFWRLIELQRAIEDEKLHLRSDNRTQEVKWWRKLPNWYVNAGEDVKKKDDQEKSKPKHEDWWKDTSYKGKTFLPLSNDIEKVVTVAGAKDAIDVPINTWGTKRNIDINRFAVYEEQEDY